MQNEYGNFQDLPRSMSQQSEKLLLSLKSNTVTKTLAQNLTPAS